jgi:hypothetical protein
LLANLPKANLLAKCVMILLRLMMLFYIFAQILKKTSTSPPPAISASGWQFDLSEFLLQLLSYLYHYQLQYYCDIL